MVEDCFFLVIYIFQLVSFSDANNTAKIDVVCERLNSESGENIGRETFAK